MIEEIKTVEEAINLLTTKRGFDVKDLREVHYNISDEDLDWNVTEKELIKYANDQQLEEEI